MIELTDDQLQEISGGVGIPLPPITLPAGWILVAKALAESQNNDNNNGGGGW